MTEPTTPAAGWYPDPAGGEGLRWWTGVTWTDDVRPSPWASATPTSAAPTVPVVTSAPPSAAPAWVVEPGAAEDDPSGSGPSSRPGRAVWLVVGAVVVVIALVAGTVAALGSLSSRNKLDMPAVEQDIAHRVAQRTGQVATVDCPDSVDIEAGASFTCSVTTADGTALDVQVHQDDDQGNLTVSGLPQ